MVKAKVELAEHTNIHTHIYGGRNYMSTHIHEPSGLVIHELLCIDFFLTFTCTFVFQNKRSVIQFGKNGNMHAYISGWAKQQTACICPWKAVANSQEAERCLRSWTVTTTRVFLCALFFVVITGREGVAAGDGN